MIPKGVILPASSAPPTGAAAGAALKRVANRPILCHVLEEMRRAGVSDVAIVVAESESDAVQACLSLEGPPGLQVRYLLYGHGPELDPARAEARLAAALAGAAEFIGDAPCVLHVADGLLDEPLTPLIGQVCDVGPDVVALAHHPAEDNSAAVMRTRRLLRIADVAPLRRPLDLAGVCLFGPGALRRSLGAHWWSSGTLDLVAVAERTVAGGGNMQIESVRGWLRYTGDVADLLEMNRIALDALPARDLAASRAGERGERIEGRVEVHPTACVRATRIVGPTIVGPRAVVQDAYIGSYTSIGADAHIEGVEVERSIILPGATIAHIGGRLAGSVVGSHARVFRDFSLPRAMRINVGDGSEVALC
jgi:glucose-1-phosphate thymidylyltransferase